MWYSVIPRKRFVQFCSHQCEYGCPLVLSMGPIREKTRTNKQKLSSQQTSKLHTPRIEATQAEWTPYTWFVRCIETKRYWIAFRGADWTSTPSSTTAILLITSCIGFNCVFPHSLSAVWVDDQTYVNDVLVPSTAAPSLRSTKTSELSMTITNKYGLCMHEICVCISISTYILICFSTSKCVSHGVPETLRRTLPAYPSHGALCFFCVCVRVLAAQPATGLWPLIGDCSVSMTWQSSILLKPGLKTLSPCWCLTCNWSRTVMVSRSRCFQWTECRVQNSWPTSWILPTRGELLLTL